MTQTEKALILSVIDADISVILQSLPMSDTKHNTEMLKKLLEINYQVKAIIKKEKTNATK
jgi:hypothetical protein